MLKRAWLLSCLCLFTGCGDQTPPEDGSVDPGEKHLTVEGRTAGGDKKREILDRAIAALGDEAAQEKLRTCKITMRCVMPIPDVAREMGGDTVLMEDCLCYPDKWRRTIRRASDGTELLRLVLNGDTFWVAFPTGKVHRMPVPPVDTRKPAALATLDNLTTLRDSTDDITIGPAEECGGRTLVPLVQMVDGRAEGANYFDQGTGLIRKSVRYCMPDLNAFPNSTKEGVPIETLTTYDAYKDFEGAILPTRMVVSQGGETVLDATVVQVEFPATFDANTFDKPQGEDGDIADLPKDAPSNALD